MRKASVKLVVRKDAKKKNGRYPVIVQLIIGRKTKKISTGQDVLLEEWNEREENVRGSADNYRQRHMFFKKQKTDFENAIFNLEMQGIPLTFEAIQNKLQNNTEENNLIAFMESELKLNRKKVASGTMNHYKSKLARLKSYQNPINIHKADYHFLSNYKLDLENDPEINSEGTVHNHMKFIRSMFNEAIRQGLTENYPFKHFPMPEPKVEEEKRFFIKEERDMLWDLFYSKTLPPHLQRSLHFFILACYTGLRHSDWNKFHDMRNGRLAFKQQKKLNTGNAFLNIPLNKKTEALIEALPEDAKVLSHTQTNIQLKEVAKAAQLHDWNKVTSHCGRHTFVIMCINEAKMTLGTVAKLLGNTTRTLEKHYAKYLDGYLRGEMDKLDDL